VEKTNENSVNLNKYISSTGICSRRESEKLIVDGCVTINDQPTQLGNRVFEGDVVKINGKPLNANPKTLYIAFNKPVGIVCTTDLKEPKNIVNFIKHPQRLFPVGRLDKPSQGLIFLTNDGDIVNKILRAGNNHEKEYIVSVRQPITSEFIQKMGGGLPILDTITKKCKVIKLNDYSFKIVLTQGLNRQIRRMCDYLSYDVTSLKRTRIMNVNLEGIKVGEWRELTEKEMLEINKMISDSSKTEEASADVHKNK
jgi:23S rRNA pseudouridine2604 synthase